MRMLNTSTLKYEDDVDPATEDYAILSHTWIQREETQRLGIEPTYETFPMVCHKTHPQLAQAGKSQDLSYGVSKIRESCSRAQASGLRYLWVDTCCINKNDTAELVESIRSMFDWYQQAQVCYVFLADVIWNPDLLPQSQELLKNSRWFTRGWTLQELLAPQDVIFFDRSWNRIGTRVSLGDEILAATGIHHTHLYGNFRDASIATKMSWASKRTTTKVEDMAYSLIGIFGVTMIPDYGEGRRAFRRLQEILVEEVADESIFAWSKPGLKGPQGILAPWLDYFANSGTITIKSGKRKYRPPYRLDKQTLEWPVPNRLVDVQNGADWNNLLADRRRHIKVTLNCWRTNQAKEDTITIRLEKGKNGEWRRIQCDQEELSKRVKGSGHWLTGMANVKPVYVALG